MYIDKPAIYTDYYELTMAQGYFLSGMHHKKANFDYFFRSNPFDGGFVVFAGLKDLTDTLQEFHFGEEELSYLEKEGFDKKFLEYLKDFQFEGSVHSVREGELVFPREPILRVKGNLVETQLIETLVLNILNFQSLIATKAARLRIAAKDRVVLDFGLRRSQGLGGVHASRAAMIGGVNGTSNVYSAERYQLPAGGTMAHSWVQSFDDELESFRTFAENYPDDTILLVDTYDTLKSGVPNAIRVAKELEEKGHQLKGIRLDSGDLAYFAKKSREMLDKEGLDYVKISASNQLDEYLIKSILSQNAPIDIFGVGTRLVTGHDSPALDGVYKLTQVEDTPTLKLSENVEKITLPGIKKIYRYFNDDGSFNGDGLLLEKEEELDTLHHPLYTVKKSDMRNMTYEPLLQKVIENGELVFNPPGALEAAEYLEKRMMKLNPEHKRFDNPHIYKVGVSNRLFELRDNLVNEMKNGIP